MKTTEPVRHADCALGIAVPLTLAELRADAAVPTGFVAESVLQQRPGLADIDEIWREWYARYAAAVNSASRAAAARGITVRAGLGAADLAELTTRFQVVTLVAHSPFPFLSVADVQDPDELLSRLRGRPTPANSSCSATLIETLRRDPELREAGSIRAFVGCFNRRLAATRDFYDGLETVDTPARASIGRGRWTMALLFEAFPDLVRPPVIMELRDGPLDYVRFADAIPAGYRGTIDAISCSALWFMEPLRRRLNDDVVLMCPAQRAFAIERLVLYPHVVDQMARTGIPYSHAVQLMHLAARHWAQTNEGCDS